MTAGAAARRFLRARYSGTLATLSSRLAGHPYASAVNYVSDPRGRPLLLLSALAEHTRNLLADARVSLLVAENALDVQAARRLTLVGTAESAPAALVARYLRHLPEAADYFRLGDFSLYAIRPLRLRLIGGFGDIRWIEGEDYCADPGELAEAESDTLVLWNHLHAGLLRAVCATGNPVTKVEIIGLDCDGGDIRADDRILRFDFGQTVSTPGAALDALAHLAGAAPA
ncbi:MAG TPA: pyridoxamine 5'-phosphate oxidase family protein [Burkholderiales bacterium]